VHEGLVEELGVALNDRKNISVADGNRTSSAKIFAAGDAALGASLVVRAIESGQKAAKGIAEALNS
jgi:glutamate synthase (NADPH/NADH) small chain